MWNGNYVQNNFRGHGRDFGRDFRQNSICRKSTATHDVTTGARGIPCGNAVGQEQRFFRRTRGRPWSAASCPVTQTISPILICVNRSRNTLDPGHDACGSQFAVTAAELLLSSIHNNNKQLTPQPPPLQTSSRTDQAIYKQVLPILWPSTLRTFCLPFAFDNPTVSVDTTPLFCHWHCWRVGQPRAPGLNQLPRLLGDQ